MSTRTLTNTATIVQDVSTPGEVLLNLNLVGGDASINTGTGALTVSKIGGQAVTLGGALTISGAFGTTLTVTNTTSVTLPVSGTLAILGANTFTALQTITQGSANAGILASTGYSLTGSNATSMLSLAGTVNTSGNPNILSASITNTAAGATTKYLNLLAGAAGATSIFSVDLTGKSIFAGLLTVTQASANAGVMASTGYSLTGSNATSLLSLAGTVNTSGNPDILSCAITNTAAGATTKYLNLLAGAAGATSIFSIDLSGNIALASSLQIAGNGIQTSPVAATLQLGAADAASPVAQTLQVQNVVGGTSNTSGTDFTVAGSVGTGTGAGGQVIFRTAPAKSTNTTQNTLATGLTITAPAVNMQPSVVVGNQALATSATDGFIYIPSCAGAAAGTPTAFTGRAPLVVDSTNNTLAFYNSAWKIIPTLGIANTWASAQTFTLGILLGSAVPLTGPASGALQLGAADAGSAVAQILQAQSVVAGTSNTAGANFTIVGSVGTGTGAGGQVILRTAPASTTGTTQNALATGLTVTAPAVGMQPSVVVGNQALATTATDGFIYIAGGAGAPTGVPTAFTGRYPLYWNTTDKKLYVYDGSWLGSTAPGVWI
jgi:hypothetical protein